MENKKVLIICPFTTPNQGGVESHIQKLVKFIGKKGRQSIVFSYQPLTTPTNAPSYEKKDNYEIYIMPWFGNGLFPKIENNPLLTFTYLVPGLLLLSVVLGLKRRKEIGVIHAHGFAGAISGIVLKFLIGKRLVLSTHAIYNLENRKVLAWLLRQILMQCDFILAVGEPSRQEIVGLGISSEKVRVHPNWVDTEFFRPRKKRKQRLENSNVQVLFVGRGLKKKGLFLFGDLARKNSKVKFVARVGDGPDLSRFIKKFDKVVNLEIRTELPKDFDEKMRVLRDEYVESDVFIMPSLYAEGFASVVLESSSCGLPMISSNLGCLPDMLEGSGAILIKPTLENFSHELNVLLSDKEFMQKLKVQMRKFALKHFSEINAEVIYESYEIK